MTFSPSWQAVQTNEAEAARQPRVHANAAQNIHREADSSATGGVGWIIDGQAVDIAPDAFWDHTRGRCGGGGCSGWEPEQTRVVRRPE